MEAYRVGNVLAHLKPVLKCVKYWCKRRETLVSPAPGPGKGMEKAGGVTERSAMR